VSYRPPGTLGVLRLLAWNSVVRVLRAAAVQKAKRTQEATRQQPERRRATKRKGGAGLTWLLVLMVPLFLFQATLMSREAVKHLDVAVHRVAPADDGKLVLPRDVYFAVTAPWAVSGTTSTDAELLGAVLDQEGVDEHFRPSRERIVRQFERYGRNGFVSAHNWHDRHRDYGHVHDHDREYEHVDTFQTPEARRLFAQCAACLLLLLALMGPCSAFGGATAALAGGDWVQPWLMSFPVQNRALVLARALEYSLVQFLPWFTLLPLTWQVLEALGQPGALWIALAATLVTTFLTGAIRLWGETVLRLHCSLRTMKNVQGACTLVSLGVMGTVFWLALSPETPLMFVDFAGALPAAVALLPGTWPLGLAGFGALAVACGVGVTLAAFAFAIVRTSRSLRGGVMRSGGVDSGERGGSGAWRRARRLGVVGKDLAMLLRDRAFFVQTLLVPVFVVVLQLVVNPALGKAEGVGIALIAYFVGFYGATGGCFQVLSSEGRALWMLYSLPVPVEHVLRRKTRLWAFVACAMGAGALLVFALRAGDVDVLRLAADLAFVVGGVWCAAHIAAAISVLGANTSIDAVQRQPKQRYVYLFLLLASAYIAALGAPELAHRVAGLTVFATLSFGLWQRACDRLRWLLDPVTDTLDRVTVLDAGAAMLVFFLVQWLVVVVLSKTVGLDFTSMTVAFLASGAFTLLAFGARLWARGVPLGAALGFVAERGTAWRASVAALVVGGGLGLMALGYLEVVRENAPDAVPVLASGDRPVLLLLGVVAAPVVEELLFRGLLLGGLLRSVPTFVAVLWSALLFTFVHPMVSWPAVFLLGTACAVVRQRSNFLPACMLMHAAYNAVVVGWQ